jgi:hypothetical protein
LKKIFDKRESLFSTSLTETFILMLFFVLSMATIGFRALNDKTEELLQNQEELNKSKENLMEINKELQEFKDFASGPAVCGFQNDKSKIIMMESEILFDIEFIKTKDKYILHFYPRKEHLDNEILNQITPNINERSFELKYSSNKRGRYHLNFSNIYGFLQPIKDSRRINQDDLRCAENKYRNQGRCIECLYWISVKDRGVSTTDLKEVYEVLEQYFLVRKD